MGVVALNGGSGGGGGSGDALSKVTKLRFLSSEAMCTDGFEPLVRAVRAAVRATCGCAGLRCGRAVVTPNTGQCGLTELLSAAGETHALSAAGGEI